MKIQVCTWNKCRANFSEYIIKRLESDKKFYNYDNVIIENCLCSSNCTKWPITFFDWNIETKVTPSIASKILLDKKNNIK